MKTNEYIQTINATLKISKHVSNLYDITQQIDMLRRLHVRLQTKLEYLLCDPTSFESNDEREKIKSIAIELREYANEYKIQINFEKLGNDYIEFSKQFRDEKQFAKYYYDNIDITQLIVFVEKRKQKTKNETIETLQQNTLTLENDFVVNDEHGNNINIIKDIDL